MRGRGSTLGTLTVATNLAALPGQAPPPYAVSPDLAAVPGERKGRACVWPGSRNNLLTGIAINPLPFCAASNSDASPFLTLQSEEQSQTFSASRESLSPALARNTGRTLELLATLNPVDLVPPSSPSEQKPPASPFDDNQPLNSTPVFLVHSPSFNRCENWSGKTTNGSQDVFRQEK